MCIQLSFFPNFPQTKPPILPKIEEEEDHIEYPSSDGKPMSENTLHFHILGYLKNSLDSLLENNPTAFVAGDLMVYYVKGQVHKRIAPDVIVAFDRDKKDRGSYIIHRENNIPPTTTFEIVSPSNLKAKPDLSIRWEKYAQMRVKEYFVIHAIKNKGFRIESFKEIKGNLVPLLDFGKHTSEHLGIEIAFENDIFVVKNLEGEVLNTYVEEVSLRKKEAEMRKKEAEMRKLAEDEKIKEAEKRKLAEEKEKQAKEENKRLKEDMAKQLQELEELRRLVNLELKEGKN